MKAEVDILVTGGTVLTIDEEDTRITQGGVAISNDRIVDLGKEEELLKRYKAKKHVHCPESIIMPGLVNAHTHAAMTCFRGIADDMELMDWLQNYIFPAEAKNVSPELVYWGSLLACVEMIKSGTTTFADMYIFEDETAQAAVKAGMRCIVGEVLYDFPSPNAKSPEEGLTYTEYLLEKWKGHELVKVMVEPHALYTCSAELLVRAKALADKYGVPLATHLLENKNEKEELARRLKKRATTYLKDLGLLDDRFVAFHCVTMDDYDIELMAEHNCKVVHNPESNMKLASGVAPISSMLRKGLCVGLGTDGCASNNNLDLLQEMDTAAKLEKSARLDPTLMNARTVVKMATIYGARVYGMADEIGSLKIGKKADICIIDCHKPHLTPLYNEFSHLAYCVMGSDVDTVIINGRLVMEKRKLLTLDEEEIMYRVKNIGQRISCSLGVNP
ncbi:MAG: amidohydrolase [Syntrophales bacterium]|nr:amidohydrolase [Syntrophales bacterium]